MTCTNCRRFHKSTSLEVVDNNLIISVTNSTNISDEDRFCFILCQRPSSVVKTAPIPVQITVNSVNIPVYNKFSKALMSDELECYYRRGLIRGYYVVNGSSSYVIFNEIPKCKCLA